MSTAVLIASCDSFADVQPAALACLEKYWSDCPWPIYTSSGTKPWGERPILTGDLPWVPAMKVALDHIDAEFVLTYLDDMLPCRDVETNWCLVAESIMKACLNYGAIRLGQGAEVISEYGRLGWGGNPRFIAIESPYRISTSPTLWRVSYLRKILDNCGPTAWDFEVEGTEYSKTIDDEILVMQQGDHDSTRPFRCYYTAITRGKWDSRCIAWLKTIGIEVEDTSRGFMPL